MKRSPASPKAIVVVGLLALVGFLGLFRVSDKAVFHLHVELERRYEQEIAKGERFVCKLREGLIVVVPPPSFPRDAFSRKELGAFAFERYLKILGKPSQVEVIEVVSPAGVDPPLPGEGVTAGQRDVFALAERSREEIGKLAAGAALTEMRVRALAPVGVGIAVVLAAPTADDAAAARAAAVIRDHAFPFRVVTVRVERPARPVFEVGETTAAVASSGKGP